MRLRGRYVLEMTIHQLDKSKRYPLGMKFGLVFVDLKTGAKIVMDNHHPKGPHIHINDRESPYELENEEKLIRDFKSLVLEHMGVKL